MSSRMEQARPFLAAKSPSHAALTPDPTAPPEPRAEGSAPPQSESLPSSRLGGHLPALDGLRGVAILLVMLAHFNMKPAPGTELTWAEKLYLSFVELGWWGVDLFFVLSGFLITGILYDAKGKGHYFRDFYMRRVLRIFPLYYGVLALAFFVVPWFWPLFGPDYEGPRGSSWWVWLYATNVGLLVNQGHLYLSDWLVFDHFWSLAVEEHFYLGWPFVVFALGRRKLLWVCAGMAVGAFGLRVGLTLAGAHQAAMFWLTPARLDSLAAGAFLALLLRGPVDCAAVARVARWIAVLTGAVLAVLVYVHCDREAALEHAGFRLFWMAGLLSVLAVFSGALLVLALHAPPGGLAGRFWRSGFLRFFGKYSYGLYVFHALLVYPFCYVTAYVHEALSARKVLHPELLSTPPFNGVLHMLVAGSLSVAIALASWHLFEKHFLKLKRFFA